MFISFFYMYSFSCIEVQVSKQKNMRKPTETKKSALCDDVPDEGSCSEKQRFLLFSPFLQLYLIQLF